MSTAGLLRLAITLWVLGGISFAVFLGMLVYLLLGGAA